MFVWPRIASGFTAPAVTLAAVTARRAAIVFICIPYGILPNGIRQPTAAFLGGANFLLAAIAVIIALKARPGRADEKMAQEIRDLASDEIKKDVDEVRNDINRISDEIAGIRAGVSSIRKVVPGSVRSAVDLADSVRKTFDDLD